MQTRRGAASILPDDCYLTPAQPKSRDPPVVISISSHLNFPVCKCVFHRDTFIKLLIYSSLTAWIDS